MFGYYLLFIFLFICYVQILRYTFSVFVMLLLCDVLYYVVLQFGRKAALLLRTIWVSVKPCRLCALPATTGQNGLCSLLLLRLFVLHGVRLVYDPQLMMFTVLKSINHIFNVAISLMGR